MIDFNDIEIQDKPTDDIGVILLMIPSINAECKKHFNDSDIPYGIPDMSVTSDNKIKFSINCQVHLLPYFKYLIEYYPYLMDFRLKYVADGLVYKVVDISFIWNGEHQMLTQPLCDLFKFITSISHGSNHLSMVITIKDSDFSKDQIKFHGIDTIQKLYEFEEYLGYLEQTLKDCNLQNIIIANNFGDLYLQSHRLVHIIDSKDFQGSLVHQLSSYTLRKFHILTRKLITKLEQHPNFPKIEQIEKGTI